MLSPTMRGLIMFGVGLVLLLNQLGIIEHSFDAIIVIASVILMFYGFVEAHGYEYVHKFLGKLHKK